MEYDSRPVAPEIINKILQAAISAPTACNYQPERILIIDNDVNRQKLNRVVPSKYYVPVAFLVCYDRRECRVRPMNGKTSGDIDASIVTTHMMFEATELGLGSIWVMYWDPNKMKEEFELSDEIEPIALLIAGYKSERAKPRKGHMERKKPNDILL